LAFFEIG